MTDGQRLRVRVLGEGGYGRPGGARRCPACDGGEPDAALTQDGEEQRCVVPHGGACVASGRHWATRSLLYISKGGMMGAHINLAC